MTINELKKIALHCVDKGYIDGDSIRYNDDLYNATRDEIDMCIGFVGEIIENGRANFVKESQT